MFVDRYVAWNAHEEIKGVFNFDGILNIRFVKSSIEWDNFLPPSHEVERGMFSSTCLAV